MKTELFRDKVVLITGASSGLGKALAYEFAKNGANVILVARRFELISEIANELTKNYKKSIAVLGDVTKDGDLEQAVDYGVENFGKIDIVIANAGFGLPGYLEDLNLEDYRRQFETNVFGVLRTIYASLKELKKTHGHICIIGSVNGAVSFSAGTSAYTMSKFAVRGLIDPLSLELADHLISVTHVMPGFMNTEFDNKHNEKIKEKYAWLKISTDRAAFLVAQAILNKDLEVVISTHGKVAVYLEKHTPFLLRGLSKIIKKM